jgi:hypothetical protein
MGHLCFGCCVAMGLLGAKIIFHDDNFGDVLPCDGLSTTCRFPKVGEMGIQCSSSIGVGEMDNWQLHSHEGEFAGIFW